MKKYYLFMFFLLIIPFKLVLADTWLDDPSYRDISWFNSSTYQETTEYIIDSDEKLAGLLYLVNIENYTFEDKYIKLIPQDSSLYQGGLYAFNMHEHEWVPINSSFKGAFVVDHTPLVNILKNQFVEGDSCNLYIIRNDGSIYDPNYQNCNLSFNMYKVEKESENSQMIGPEVVPSGISVEIEVVPDEGYHVESVRVIEDDGNEADVVNYALNKYRFRNNSKHVTVKANVKKNDNKYCYPIKGNGKNLGDEVVCGTEHFYIISNDGTNVKMMAKYNLNTGYTIYKREKPDNVNCYSFFDYNIGENYVSWYPHYEEGYCFYYKYIDEYPILQNEEAISAHINEEGKYLYPQVGDVNLRAYENRTYDDTYISDTHFKNYSYDIESFKDDLELTSYSSNTIGTPLFLYKKELANMGIVIDDISILSLSELYDIINDNFNKQLPLKEWEEAMELYDSYTQYDVLYILYSSFGYIKDYIPEEHKWLYSTTYWNRTINDVTGSTLYVFTTSLGKVCGAGIGYCMSYANPGAGVRPVVTMSSDNIFYLIDTETDNHGDIEVVDHSLGDKSIKFKINANKGYELKSIIIVTESGQTITYEKGDLISNDDGTISIDNNLFTMPFENITIKVLFNPLYSFIDGMHQEFNISKDSDMRFKVNMEYEDFIAGGKIFIDNKEIDCNCYVVSEGSTVITFKDECTKDFKTGKHEIVAMLKDGNSARTDFTIKKDLMDIIDDIPIVREIINPETSDKIFLVIILLFGSWLLFNYSKANKTSKYGI